MLTITANINDPSLELYLEKRAALHQLVLRKMFVALYIREKNWDKYKGKDQDAGQGNDNISEDDKYANLVYNHLANEYGLFAVEINSIRQQTKAIYSSWKELLVKRIDDEKSKIEKLDAKIKATIKSGKKTKRPDAIHQWKRRLHRYRLKLERLEAEDKKGLPRICFGSKALFYKQFELEANDFKDQEEWKEAWITARSKAFYLAGRANEDKGNAACKITEKDSSNDSYQCILHLRKTNAEISSRGDDGKLKQKKAKPEDYINIPITFSYYGRFIAYAVDQNKPITYRFICIDGVWKVQLIVAHPNIPYVTDEKNGSIGIDQNPLNISYASIKADGNCEISEVFKLVQGHRSANQAKNELANVVNRLVDLAVLTKRPIVIEKLNFQHIQKELKGRGLNRLLSRFKYSLFHKLLYSRATKHGVQIVEVNPAFSSIIGWLKYGYGYGLSRHQAAALAIGRRIIRPNGKRFSERICVRFTPGHPVAHLISEYASDKPACKSKGKRSEHVWTGWNRLRKLSASRCSTSTGAGKSIQPAVSRQLASGSGEKVPIL